MTGKVFLFYKKIIFEKKKLKYMHNGFTYTSFSAETFVETKTNERFKPLRIFVMTIFFPLLGCCYCYDWLWLFLSFTLSPLMGLFLHGHYIRAHTTLSMLSCDFSSGFLSYSLGASSWINNGITNMALFIMILYTI